MPNACFSNAAGDASALAGSPSVGAPATARMRIVTGSPAVAAGAFDATPGPASDPTPFAATSARVCGGLGAGDGDCAGDGDAFPFCR